MESRATKIYSNVNKNAIIRVIPGRRIRILTIMWI